MRTRTRCATLKSIERRRYWPNLQGQHNHGTPHTTHTGFSYTQPGTDPRSTAPCADVVVPPAATADAPIDLDNVER